MASSLTGGKPVVVSSLAEKLSVVVVSRRVFAAASAATAGVVFGVVGTPAADMMRKIDQTAGTARESAWAPDPATGCYRPADRAAEIDAAELREMLLNPGRNK